MAYLFWFYSTAKCSFHLLLLVVFDEIARPERQIVSQKLHDGRWVTVLFLLQVFQVRDGIIESGFSELACQVRWAHNFVVEYGVVKGEAKTDWVRRLQLLCLLLRELVRILRLINDCLAFILYEELTKITVVVTLHFPKEYVSLSMLRLLQQVIIQQFEHLSANRRQLVFDLLPVHLDQIQVFVALYLRKIYQILYFFVLFH